jgi:Domain of unknown function (DUF4112)
MTPTNAREVLQDILADPFTEIKAGKYLALKGQGGIILKGSSAQLLNGAQMNHEAIVFLVLLHRQNNTAIHIHDRSMVQVAGIDMAIIADFFGVKHDYKARRMDRVMFEDRKQRIFAQLRERYPDIPPLSSGKNGNNRGTASPPSPEPKPPPVNDNRPPASLTPQQQAILKEITEVAKLMDAKLGGVIGLDALADLIPFLNVVGSPAAALPSLWIVWRAKMMDVPNDKLVRMLGNIGIDTGIGLIPVPGVNFVADALFKANILNLNIIHDHFGLPPYKRR